MNNSKSWESKKLDTDFARIRRKGEKNGRKNFDIR